MINYFESREWQYDGRGAHARLSAPTTKRTKKDVHRLAQHLW